MGSRWPCTNLSFYLSIAPILVLLCYFEQLIRIHPTLELKNSMITIWAPGLRSAKAPSVSNQRVTVSFELILYLTEGSSGSSQRLPRFFGFIFGPTKGSSDSNQRLPRTFGRALVPKTPHSHQKYAFLHPFLVKFQHHPSIQNAHCLRRFLGSILSILHHLISHLHLHSHFHIHIQYTMEALSHNPQCINPHHTHP